MKLSFSTLACPQWSWERIVEQARVLGYDGIELRGVLDELDPLALETLAPAHRAASLSRLDQLKLSLPCIDTSCTFLSSQELSDTLREGRAIIDLAQAVGAPWVRFFGDRIPTGMADDDAVTRISLALNELGRYAQGTGVSVLLETHGSFADPQLTQRVFARVDSPATGVLWDIANPVEAGFSAETVWELLSPLIAHVHVKDVNARGKPCLPGAGVVPIPKCVQLLRDGGYDGWLSFEWERRWYTGIEAPEVALPAFIEYMSNLL